MAQPAPTHSAFHPTSQGCTQWAEQAARTAEPHMDAPRPPQACALAHGRQPAQWQRECGEWEGREAKRRDGTAKPEERDSRTAHRSCDDMHLGRNSPASWGRHSQPRSLPCAAPPCFMPPIPMRRPTLLLTVFFNCCFLPGAQPGQQQPTCTG